MTFSPAISRSVLFSKALASKQQASTRQLTRTAGQIAVGGSRCSLNWPKSHSIFPLLAHLLCSYKKTLTNYIVKNIEVHFVFRLIAKKKALIPSTDTNGSEAQWLHCRLLCSFCIYRIFLSNFLPPSDVPSKLVNTTRSRLMVLLTGAEGRLDFT